MLNKACRWAKQELADIRSSLPFPLQGINKTIYDFCTPGIIFTRSRPGKKNDNFHVKCKNDTAVRQHVGYARFSGEEARKALSMEDDRVSLGAKEALQQQHGKIDILALTSALGQALVCLNSLAVLYTPRPLSRTVVRVRKSG